METALLELVATSFMTLAASCAPNVAPSTMQAIVMAESSGNPLSIGVNSGGNLQRQPRTHAEAVSAARLLLARGANFDAGLAQINSANFARLGLTAENVFEPCTNLRAGAAVLSDNYSRAKTSGHASPLLAAISEYNTGSRSRGFSNGYVGRVLKAAGQTVPVVRVSSSPSYSIRGNVSLSSVASLLSSAFDARITDTARPINAGYGAENSYHKVGRAIDFVPRGGLRSITREQIRALMAANGVRLIELLGPGDRGHSDHWHIAFAADDGAPSITPSAPAQAWTVAASSPEQPSIQSQEGAFRVAASLETTDGGGEALAANEPPPPAWDIFALADWHRRQSSGS